MATFRVVWQFLESNGSSFNEVYYLDITGAAQACRPGGALIAARVQLLSSLNKLQRIRASQVDQQRVTATATYAISGTAKVATGPTPAGAAAVIGMGGSTGGQRKLWLRGLPIAWYNRNGVSGADDPPADFLAFLENWLSALQKANYGIRRLTPANPQTLPSRQILTVDGSAENGTSVLTLDLAPGWPVPSRIVIGGCSKKDTPALNGHYSVTAVNAAKITIPYATPGDGIVNNPGGHCRLEQYQPTSPISANASGFDHYGTRTTRSPLFNTRGARRAQRLRLLD